MVVGRVADRRVTRHRRRPSGPGRRAARGRGRRSTVSHGVVVSAPSSVGGHDGADAAGVVALEPDEAPSTRSHGTPAGGVPIATAGPGRRRPRAAARRHGRHEPGEVVARDRPAGSRRRRSRRRSRAAWTWSMPRRRPGDDRRARRRWPTTSLPSAASRTRTSCRRAPPRRPRRSPLDPPPMTATSTSTPLDLDRPARAGSRQVRARHDGEWRVRRRPGAARPRSPGPGRGLARPDVGDAVDRREAVRRSRRPGTASRRGRAPRRPAGSRSRPSRPARTRPAGRRRRSARRRPRRRPSGASVTGASAGPPGRTAARGWSRAGRRRPMISISKPSPPGPSGVASAVGT